MEQLGLGVRLTLDDDMSSEINPIIRDMERLRRQAQKTTATYNQMRDMYNPYSRNRRQEMKDYYESMASHDRVLLNISDRFIRATNSANNLRKSINRMQFTGHFQYMYKDIMRVQKMLGDMGYGMSKMQREMSNLRAYQMMDVQMKDLKDRITLTTKALKEMQQSPDASKMVKEMNIAKRSLQAYKNELSKVGKLQEKLAQTHGLGYMKSATGAKEILYEQPKSAKEMAKNQLIGLGMTDMAIASAIATSSLNKTEQALAGTGNTALETKKKIMQMATSLQTLGMTLTPIVSLFSAIALGGWGYLAGKNEKANAQMTGQSLVPMGTAQNDMYQASMRKSFANSSGSNWDNTARQYSIMHNADITKTADMELLSMGANEIGYAQGLDSIEVLTSVMSIAKDTGASYADSLDLISLGLKSTDGDLEKATESVLANAGAFRDANGEWKNAFETLEAGNKDGSINNLFQSMKSLSTILTVMWDKGMKPFMNGLASITSSIGNFGTAFLTANPGIAKFSGAVLGIALGLGVIIPPILLVSGFMVRFRSAIQGVGMAVQALTARGGIALMSAQSHMLGKQVHAVTVALARFPQTLLLGVLPALYNVVRMIPQFLLNMARINPVMGGLTLGVVAYSKNWFGFADSVDYVTGRIKNSWDVAKGLIDGGLGGADLKLSTEDLSGVEGTLLKIMGTAKLVKPVLSAIFKGEKLELTDGQINLAKQLGIENALSTIANVGRAVKDFTTGFADGIQLVYDKAKTFLGWMVDTFEPVIINIGNAISKLFGGSGDAKSIEDVMNYANNAGDSMKNLGKLAGAALFGLLGFKLLKPVFDKIFKNPLINPFKGITTGAKLASNAVKALGGVMGKVKDVRNISRNTVLPSNVHTVPNLQGKESKKYPKQNNNTPSTDWNTPTGTQHNRVNLSQAQIASIPRTERKGYMSTTGGLISGFINRRAKDFDTKNTTQHSANRNTLGVTQADYAKMSANQRNNFNRQLTNARATARGYDLRNDYTSARQGRGNSEFINNRVAGQAGTQAGLGNQQRQQLRAIHEHGTIQGSTVYARRQNRLSTALFGQAYDRFDEQGRRRTVNRQGGLLRRQSSDLRVTDSLGVRDRASIATRNAVRATGQATTRVVRQAGGAVAQTARMTGAMMGTGARQVVNSRAMKPITVPIRYVNSKVVQPMLKPIRGTVNWVTGRLRTAGVIRQGQQGGQQAGNRFKRAFNAATRTLGTGARMFNGAVRSAGSAGRQAGNGMLKGMTFLSKGIGKVVGAGFRAIPILGWALMAWDIISTIFTNWESIKSGAQKAWGWIQENGVSALQSAWETIKGYALSAWGWIQENGQQTAINIANGIISFIGNAWTTILSLAGKALAWILTDGIAKAIELGTSFFKFVGEAFPKVVKFAVEVFTGLISTAGSIAVLIGSAMLNGIKSAMSGLGAWIGEQISKVPGGSFVVEKLTGKKYARGGIINSPHMGIVGEAGPEVIIPLSGNQRNRASMLLEHTAGVLGMNVQKVGSKEAEMPLQDVTSSMNSKVEPVKSPLQRSIQVDEGQLKPTPLIDLGITTPKEGKPNVAPPVVPNIAVNNVLPNLLPPVVSPVVNNVLPPLVNNVLPPTVNNVLPNVTAPKAVPNVVSPLVTNIETKGVSTDTNSSGFDLVNVLRKYLPKFVHEDVKNPTQDVYLTNPDTSNQPNQIVRTEKAEDVKLNQQVVRNSGGLNKPSNEVASGDNSVTIQKLEINIQDGKEVTDVGARKHAVALAKEFQKLMKQERMRSRGKNLSFEEMILNL